MHFRRSLWEGVALITCVGGLVGCARFQPQPLSVESLRSSAPDVDEARGCLVSDLLLSQVLDTIGWVKGV